MIALDDAKPAVHEAFHTAGRVGAIAHNITQNDAFGDPLPAQILQHRFKRRRIRMDVGEYCQNRVPRGSLIRKSQ